MVTPPGFEPGIPPWKGGVLTAWPWGLNFSIISSIYSVVARTVRAVTRPTINLVSNSRRAWMQIGLGASNRLIMGLNSMICFIYLFIGCGSRIWTYDLRVMSPTSYQTALSRANLRRDCPFILSHIFSLYGAENRNRTDTMFNHRRILSPVRLPVPPPRHDIVSSQVAISFYKLVGAQGGTRTHNLPVNSRVLHHWAT